MTDEDLARELLATEYEASDYPAMAQAIRRGDKSGTLGPQLRAISRAPMFREGWQSIETAPKDGSPLRLYDPERDDGEMGSSWDGHWSDGDGWMAGVWCNHQDCWGSVQISPTHWMPHPAPPRETDATADTPATT